MPFCRNCGKENTPGQNFCAECGAPLKSTASLPPPPPPLLTQDAPVPPEPVRASLTPAPPAPPAGIPQAPPPPSLTGTKPTVPKNMLIAIAAAAIMIIAAAYFIALPMLKGAPGATTGLPPTMAVTTVPTRAPAETTVPVTPVITQSPTPKETFETRYEETYEEIYSSTKAYRFGEKVTLPHTLVRPPLYIKFNVTPVMVNDTKLVDIGLSTEHEVFAIYPDPAAWFEVKVLAAAGGTPADSRGYGIRKGYSGVNQQEFMIRTGGDYIIEMSGNMVTTSVQIRIGTS
jgi:hypothetical protein